MVGMQSWLTPVRSASALPNPVVDPPPSETMQSASQSFMAASAHSVTSTGVCIVALEKMPANSGPSAAPSLRALRFLLRRSQQQRTLRPEALKLLRRGAQRAAAEHNSAGQILEGE